MSVIFFLIIIGIVVAGGFLIAFIWSVKSGQYDDDYTPSVRILFDNYKTENILDLEPESEVPIDNGNNKEGSESKISD
jgi:cbb3-type cytochrome oxidase maturation protein